MTAPQPVTPDELATIKAGGAHFITAEKALRLVAEIERLRALNDRVPEPRAYPGNAIEYGGMVHYIDDDHKTHHPDVTCSCSPTPIWVPRP